ncbi:MAG TPA: hypothetical protein VFP44_20285 [Usitatibacter sp.]|nr:hypothetical protein [Usitatibacter sp.]
MTRSAFAAHAIILIAASTASASFAQDASSYLESQGLEPRDLKTFQDLEIVVARPKPGTEGDERVIVLRQGKPLWHTDAKDAEPGSRWTIHSVGRELAGDGHPDAHISSFTNGAHCCTTHHVVQLKPQVKRIAAYPAGNVAGGDFIDVPGRKAPVMISADDSSANAFAPYATSYFPLLVLEVGPRGRFQLARDLMQSKLPGQPPAICATNAPAANAWLRERCGEFTTVRRQERVSQVKAHLGAVKEGRSVQQLKWDDYVSKGALGPIAAELNRYAYTGHGAAGLSWLETVWPGNDAIKLQLLSTLRQTQAKSAFADDLKALGSGR